MRERTAQERLEAAERWLVDVLGFPFDMSFEHPPNWTTPKRLAPLWVKRDGEHASDLDEYVALIDEEGWA